MSSFDYCAKCGKLIDMYNPKHDCIRDPRASVMIDPSLLLVERSLNNLEHHLTELSNSFSFYISRRFCDIIQEGNPEALTIDYFRYTSKLVDIDRLKTFLDEKSEYIQKFEIPEWASIEYYRSFGSIVTSLPYQYRYDETLHNIIFEEWFFLKTHSWLVARTKRIFNLFIRGGAASLEFGGKIFDALARKSLRLPQAQLITDAHRLRTIAKWMAVTGNAHANLFAPEIQVLADMLVPTYFMLIDP